MSNIIPMQDVQTMALAVAKSGLFGAKSPEQALALMLVAQAEGRHPALAARDYDIINGRPAKKAEAMLRDFLSAGGKVEWHELSDTTADATFSHEQGGTFRCHWDMVRAKKAEIGGKGMWLKYPRQMLRSRCVSEGVRTVWPSATSGMYVPEEVQDFDDKPRSRVAKDITPPAPALPAPITPTTGALEALAPERREFVTRIADAAIEIIHDEARDSDERLAEIYQYLYVENLDGGLVDNDEFVAIWHLLKPYSWVRNKLKKIRQERTTAAAPAPADEPAPTDAQP